MDEGEVVFEASTVSLQRKGWCPPILLCHFSALGVPRGLVLFLDTDLAVGWGLWWGFCSVFFPVWKTWPRVGCEMGMEAALATSIHIRQSVLPLYITRSV